MGNWKTVNTTTGSSMALAPNVTIASSSIGTVTWAHLTIPEFTVQVTLPGSLGTLGYLELFAKDPSSGVQISLGFYDSGFTGGGTMYLTGSSDRILQTASAQPGWILKVVAYNTEYTPTPGSPTVTVSIPGYGITLLTASDDIADRWVDGNRSVYAPITTTIHFGAYPSPTFTIWGYNGVKHTVHGWYAITADTTWKLGDKGRGEIIFAPEVDTTYTVSAAPGAWYGDDTVGWTCPDLGVTSPITTFSSIPGLVSATPFTLHKMGMPLNSNITTVVLDPGIGGNYPYDETDASGFHDWCVQNIIIDPTNARNDPNTFTIIMTCEDLDKFGNSIGPEHIYGTPQVSAAGTVMDMGMLNGPYGSVATPPRSGSIGKVKLRFYCGNRLDQTTEAWRNSAATTLQNVNGVGYAIFTVAVNGDTPSGTVSGSRNASTNRTRATTRVASAGTADATPWAGIIGPINVGGGGAAQTIWEVKNASGTVIGWIGKKTISGTDYYGFWTSNIWIGGTDPTNPKAWLDNLGNLHLLGAIESGSTLSLLTASGTVTVDASTNGIKVLNPLTGVYTELSYGSLFASDGSYTSFMSASSLSLANTQLVTDNNGRLTKYDGKTLAGKGVGHFLNVYKVTGQTSGISFSPTSGGASLSGTYRVSLAAVLRPTATSGFSGSVTFQVVHAFGLPSLGSGLGSFNTDIFATIASGGSGLSTEASAVLLTNGIFVTSAGFGGIQVNVLINTTLTNMVYDLTVVFEKLEDL